jgi:hypothetical protein
MPTYSRSETNTARIAELCDLIKMAPNEEARAYMQAEIDGLMEVQMLLANFEERTDYEDAHRGGL